MNQRRLLSFVLAVLALATGLKSEAAPETPDLAKTTAFPDNMPNAVAPSVSQLNGQTFASVLNIDGSIKPGTFGSFDAKGFRMTTDNYGSPRFFADNSNAFLSAQTSCGDGWDDRFATNGLNGWAYVITVSGTDVYVGGTFTQAGSVSANYIARWNGSSWSALGSGLNDEVYSIAVSGTDVYVGGKFTQAGGVSANHIAKWNGSSWSALSFGMNGYVYALAMTNGNLYAGGDFTAAGAVAAPSSICFVMSAPPSFTVQMEKFSSSTFATTTFPIGFFRMSFFPSTINSETS